MRSQDGRDGERWAVALLTAALTDEVLYADTMGVVLNEVRQRRWLAEAVTVALVDRTAELLRGEAQRRLEPPELVMLGVLEILDCALEVHRIDEDIALRQCAAAVQMRATADLPPRVTLGKLEDARVPHVQIVLEGLVVVACTTLCEVCSSRDTSPEAYLRRWGQRAAA